MSSVLSLDAEASDRDSVDAIARGGVGEEVGLLEEYAGPSGTIGHAYSYSLSRRPSSFILVCRLLREIWSLRAAWVTLPAVSSRAR